MKLIKILIFAVIVLSFVIGIYFYPKMPDMMASHWNVNGEVDDYMSKFWGLFLMPFISVIVLLLFILIPNIDPLKENIKKFRGYFDGFILMMALFLFYLYILTISWSLGKRFDMAQLLSPAFGALFFYAGFLVEKAKRNWFIGIRNPWTLSSDKVWEKTHKIGGKLFKIAGVVALFGIFFKKYALFLMLALAIFMAVYTLFYSYFEYHKNPPRAS